MLSDGLACFNGVTAAGCVHEPMVTGGGKAAVERPEFRWVNTILGNIKNALCGTYHAVRPKYAQRYLAEFGTAAQVTLGLSGNQDILWALAHTRFWSAVIHYTQHRKRIL